MSYKLVVRHPRIIGENVIAMGIPDKPLAVELRDAALAVYVREGLLGHSVEVEEELITVTLNTGPLVPPMSAVRAAFDKR